jgi:hypothetical protein
LVDLLARVDPDKLSAQLDRRTFHRLRELLEEFTSAGLGNFLRWQGLLNHLSYNPDFSGPSDWRNILPLRPVRIVYTSAGRPTATLLEDDASIVESKLFWVTCQGLREAQYLLAIINSDALYEAVIPYMSKGQFGARDLQKHLWSLSILAFDPSDELHAAIADAGAAAAEGAAALHTELRADAEGRGELDKLTVTAIRRELRDWLAVSDEGRAVEQAVGRLLRA